MKKSIIRIILLIVLILLMGLIVFILLNFPKDNNSKFFCNQSEDCVSQCRNGCVNSDWAALNPDTTECFRAWDCSCFNKECYTDGNPPKN